MLGIRSQDGEPFPEVEPVCIRLTRDDEIWQTKLLAGEHRPDPIAGATMVAGAGPGPDWRRGETVRFVVWLRVDGVLHELDLGNITVSSTV